jgi:segregation and condensation protein A
LNSEPVPVVMEDNSQTETVTNAVVEGPNEATQTISVANSQPEITPDGDTDQLKITLGDFEGPLDLLLYLIRQEQVNIYDIPIARITDEYLRYLNLMQELDLTVAGDFLVMAAQLIEVKSRMLLPRDPLAEEEEMLDPRAELVDRLLEHEKFKAAAEMLWSRATVERAVFTRAEIETDKNNPEVVVGLFDLLRVFQEILARHKEEVLMEIEREEVSMAEMIDRLRNMVRSAGEVNLMTFFERAKSRRELVVAFLSVLELVRMSEVSLVQSVTFGAIMARTVPGESARDLSAESA